MTMLSVEVTIGAVAGHPFAVSAAGVLHGKWGLGVGFSAYAEWQEALEQAFFSEEWDGHPVILFIDERKAESLQQKYRVSVPLVEAVRQVVQLGAPRPFRAVEDYESSRRSDDSAPSVLPLLACSVVAATQMANDGVHRANNYHDRFSELLAGRAGVLTSQLYLPVAEMWQRLAAWQVRWGGYRGVCTIPSMENLPHHQARIGYALSQAVLRDSDRQHLLRFFNVMRARDEAAWPLPGTALARGISVWDYEAKFSASFQHALHDPDLRPLIEDLLAAIAAAWDGSDVYIPHGSLRGELLVRFENRRLGWLVRLPQPGDPSYQLEDGVVLRRVGATEYYMPEGLALPTGRTLQNEVRLHGDGIAISRSAAPLVLLRQNVALDCRTSTERFLPGEDHMILAAPEAARDVERILGRAASPGRSKEPGRLSWMPEGWTLHNHVVFDDPVTLRSAILDTKGAVIGTIPAPNFKARLEGGLLLAPDLSRNLYLVGGEPDLVLPDGTVGGVLLDDQGVAPEPDRAETPLRLSACDLTPGDHTVQAGESSLEFVTAESAPSPREATVPLGFPFGGEHAKAYAAQASSHGLIRGAAVNAGLAEADAEWPVLLCRRGADETLFLSADGRGWRVAAPDTPGWWDRLPETPSGYCFEVRIPACGGWVFQSRRGVWHLEAALPAYPCLEPNTRYERWAQTVMVVADAGTGDEWEACVRLAQEVVQ
ncbi:hypothetical protein ACFXA4_16455 [Streptomyces sp. NPDC059442]|uniref:hypothetical protein n=1 Tax=Streptomyces sp. NPDC059442 TaxID=3346830 RepID=UPI0036AD4E42